MAGAATTQNRNKRVGIMMFAMAAAMLGLGFAAVPLYNLFCRVTGFAGTTQVATDNDAVLAEQMAKSAGLPQISIRFDGSVARGMPWEFGPEQTTDTVQIGQRDMAFFYARNTSDHAITGAATYNVEPEQAGPYFNKIQCFCFTEQTLQPGQEVRMPVLFYVDPKALDDPNMKGVEQITLSYTFHEAKDQPS
ncbi:cytochrome c oxidase assembly protein [Erythrobacter sp. LQ02-29]|uniref:cytochrome c oxidase assembly protein n=1 Tax=unclassified Erythrobacter TaxID=2633097 RepID=UPI001BFC62C0|nr:MULTISPECIES: cytochrome c oxidase assembly protein [unclassified Erythrobacter]MCP9223760.1 cytochrome c oxidase assembly protein [Erythrobacter sp. LQ02-29]QWC57572.1 cytochrome c oxidase assembly protein [Erythrobacter sp. 3-20A1M]